MKRIFKIISRFFKQVKEDNVTSYAASCSFFIFLSLIPMIMLLFAILPYTPAKPELLIEWVVKEFPADTGSFIIAILNEVSTRSAGVVSVTAIATLWSAGKGVNSLIAGFNAIDGNVDKRNGIWLRVISCVYTLIFLIGVVFTLLLVVGGNVIMGIITGYFPTLAFYFSKLMHFRTLITIGALSVLFMLCFALLPYKKHKFREQIPGAFFSALGWTGFSYLFSFYVNKFNAFSMYGSLTAIVILMFWMYTCMYILFLGDNLNKYFRPVIKTMMNKSSLSEVKGQLESLEE